MILSGSIYRAACCIIMPLLSGGCGDGTSRLIDVNPTPIPSAEQHFPDRGLESAVRAQLEQADGHIDSTQLQALTALDASGYSIDNLQGIEQLHALKTLRLARNTIRDLTPLGTLDSLAVLDLSNNGLFSLAPLATLSGLTHLNLDFNRIVSIAPLASMSQLELLNLTGNRIADISALSRLNRLKNVELSGNPLNERALTTDLPALVRRGVQV
ncbi:MAG: hypothetical protein VXW00_12710, partial [Candidatus Latescibacterota bacterium]|nr:hypothetical protein [Candidatus Latescibacterota bacterium]